MLGYAQAPEGPMKRLVLLLLAVVPIAGCMWISSEDESDFFQYKKELRCTDACEMLAFCDEADFEACEATCLSATSDTGGYCFHCLLDAEDDCPACVDECDELRVP